MGILGRFLLSFLVLVAVLGAVITLFVWWLPVTILGATAAVFLALALAAERREARWRAAGAADAEARQAALDAAERRLAIDRAYSDLPGFGDVAGYFRFAGWYTRFMAEPMGMDPGDPLEMRWWAAGLLLVAGLFGTVGVASHAGSWAMGLPVLFALAVSSFAVAAAGQRAAPEPRRAE